MSDEANAAPRISPRTGLPIIPKGPPRPTGRCGERPSAALVRAAEQFNAGQYWEAHETLEELWRHEEDPVRSLYQGILLVGVGLHHLLRGNYHGATTKLQAGLERLAPYEPACQGVDVARLRAEAGRCLATVQEAGPRDIGAVDGTLLPRISLEPAAHL
jgi:hypothetical protein